MLDFLSETRRFSTISRILVFIVLCLSISQATAQQRRGLSELDSLRCTLNLPPGEYDTCIWLKSQSREGLRLVFSLYNEENEDSWLDSIEICQTTAIRAMIFDENGPISDTVYHGTYLIGRPSSLPVISLHLDWTDFVGPNGILRGTFEEIGEGDEKEIIYSGRVWEKSNIPVLFEFLKQGERPYAGAVRLQPFGGMTLGYAEKSMRVFTDTLIGPKKIRIDPFYNKRNKGYKSIVFRTSGNDYCGTRIKDVTLSSLARGIGIDYLDYCPAILYVNGQYWGIYNMREKCNKDYLKYNHGAPKDSTTILLRGSGTKSPEYMELLSYVEQEFPEGTAIDSVNQKMALENYINYIIWQIHIINLDSRGNVRFWKSSSLDNRWRWIFYDSDLGCSLDKVNFNYLRQRLRTDNTEWYNPEWSTRLLRGLVAHPDIRNYFINQYCYLLGTALHKDTILNRIDYFASIIRPEIAEHVKRRNSICGSSVRAWENNILLFKQFFEMRELTAYDHLMENFGLTQPPLPVRWGSNLPAGKAVRLVNTEQWIDSASTVFFPEIPVTLEAKPEFPKYVFSHWNDSPSKSTTFTLTSDSTDLAIAKYVRRDTSSLHPWLVCNFLYSMRKSRDSSLYIIGFRLDSLKKMNPVRLTMMTAEAEDIQELRIDTLYKDGFIFIANDSAKARKIVGPFRILQLASLVLPEKLTNELVIWDAERKLLDTLAIRFPDSLLKSDAFYASRNYGDSAWHFQKIPVMRKLAEPEPPDTDWLFWTVLVLTIGMFFDLLLRKKKPQAAACILMLFLTNGVSAQTSSEYRFGLDSAHTRLINNKGEGYDSLGGLRNFRVVLKNTLYRSGNNHPESFQNPLELSTLDNLKGAGFDRIFYLYEKNFDTSYPDPLIDSLDSQGLTYRCTPHLDSVTVRHFLELIMTYCTKPNGNLVLIHCWNGWHQSGLLSALTLRQFCDYSPEEGLAYWIMNTDGNHKGYNKLKLAIRDFRPYPDLQLTANQKKEVCPCLKLDPAALAEAKSPIVKPIEKTYLVKKGDTLGSISLKTGVSLKTLMALNRLKKGSILQVGQKIKLQ